MSNNSAMDVPISVLSTRERRIAVVLLMLIYTSNFVDRSILNILAQPIKEDIGLHDWQLGLLGGFAFATLYALLGVPLARLADRFNRVRIICSALSVWSVMTVLCGLVQSFGQLFLGRVGVGIGEAGCTPTAHSLISDLYPASKRASALAFYSLGIPLGTFTGIVAGGIVGQALGWRFAFMAVGLPGILLAAVTYFLVREPARGGFDPPTTLTAQSLRMTLKKVLGDPVLLHLTAGLTLATFAGAGIGAFISALLLRGGFGVDLRTTALATGVIGVAASLIGTAGSAIVDFKWWPMPNQPLLLPAIGFLLGGPLYVLALLQSSFWSIVLCSVVPQILVLLYLGPSFAVIHNGLDARSRASVVAMVFMVLSLFGTGLGPVTVGWASDMFYAMQTSGGRCAHHVGAIGDGACGSSYEGLRYALIAAACMYFWAGIHYLFAHRWMRKP